MRGSDEVGASALKFCQEVCAWANELRLEVLSQETWPGEGPAVLASPPLTLRYNGSQTTTLLES